MKHLARATLTLAGASALLAVWQPVGSWWQWAITAVLFLLAGAGFGAAADMRGPAPHPADGSDLELHFREKFEHEQRADKGNSAGPHVHITPDDDQQHKRKYGRKAGDQ